MEGKAIGVIEGGLFDAAANYSIQAIDDIQAKMNGSPSVKTKWNLDPEDEDKICVVSVTLDNLVGITGTGGVFVKSTRSLRQSRRDLSRQSESVL